MQKVKCFGEYNTYDLTKAINDFAKYCQILQISYTTEMVGYQIKHCCMVLYEE